ncbi:hypothetical protein W911_04685 [Hyphomicrobium nitrativorans NL23]|uniref:Replication protein n=1 Tax=Hyphomicrobium nitrativorans NL23 TaxID=1029756 RepID=V5SIQ0_9HYPH|nr:hypothetical protein [Hyphomicrobium nitrativorans]AHB49955.1 hypothetical protein W911_04685 [Hyphomicrobium nitrativorans NL23]
MVSRVSDGSCPAAASALPAGAQDLQYDLFTRFFGKPENLSNTIELWDALPKYSFSARMQALLRDASGRLPLYQRAFDYRPAPKAGNPTLTCTLSLQPASLLIDGKRVDFYPSTDEELIEEVLKKIFTDQACGYHDSRRGESWVRFTLHMIRTELARRGRTRSIAEIKQSLEILSKTVVDVAIEGRGAKRAVYTNPILSDLTRVTRLDLAEDPKSMWTARLPALLSASINALSYRQFNYAVLMSLKSPLARWLHKRLSHEYTNAHLTHPYRILYSTIDRDSGLLHNCRTSANLKSIERALDELIAHRVLLATDSARRMDGASIRDVLFTLTPHVDFVSDIKAANARAQEARTTIDGASNRIPISAARALR